MARTVKLQVRLSPEMVRRLEGVAARLGMGRADTAALAIGAWIAQQESYVEVQQVVAQSLRPILEAAARQTIVDVLRDAGAGGAER